MDIFDDIARALCILHDRTGLGGSTATSLSSASAPLSTFLKVQLPGAKGAIEMKSRTAVVGRSMTIRA